MKSFFPEDLSSLSDAALYRALTAVGRTLTQVQDDQRRIRAELAKREADQLAAKQAACRHPKGFVGMFVGVCPDCGFEGDPL
jgi:hypothetical protein